MVTVGSKCKSGQVVSEVLGQSKRACCFFTEDNHIRSEYAENEGQVPSEMMPAISRFDAILKKIKACVASDVRRTYYEHAAKSLFSVLDVNDPSKISDYFREIESSLNEICNAPIYYSVSGLLSSAGLAVFVLYLLHKFGTDDNSVFFWASITGITGAALSVLQRGGKIWSAPDTKRWIVIIQGAMRPISGAILGLAAVLLIRAKLILGTFDSSSQLLVTASFIFGLSERLIPEMSRNLERKITED